MTKSSLGINELGTVPAVDEDPEFRCQISDEEFSRMERDDKWGHVVRELNRLKNLVRQYVTAVDGYHLQNDETFARVGRSRLFITAEDVANGIKDHGRCLKAIRTLLSKKGESSVP